MSISLTVATPADAPAVRDLLVRGSSANTPARTAALSQHAARTHYTLPEVHRMMLAPQRHTLMAHLELDPRNPDQERPLLAVACLLRRTPTAQITGFTLNPDVDPAEAAHAGTTLIDGIIWRVRAWNTIAEHHGTAPVTHIEAIVGRDGNSHALLQRANFAAPPTTRDGIFVAVRRKVPEFGPTHAPTLRRAQKVGVRG
jgi:hypothetical protein